VLGFRVRVRIRVRVRVKIKYFSVRRNIVHRNSDPEPVRTHSLYRLVNGSVTSGAHEVLVLIFFFYLGYLFVK